MYCLLSAKEQNDATKKSETNNDATNNVKTHESLSVFTKTTIQTDISDLTENTNGTNTTKQCTTIDIQSKFDNLLLLLF